MINEKHTISVVVPVYNEESVIESFIDELILTLKKMKYSYEIILVDDGSIDNTLEKIKILIKKYDHIKFLSFTRNFGHQPALYAGTVEASGTAIIMMDADLQHPPPLIMDLVRLWESGYKVVQTIRKDKNISHFKTLTSKLFYFLLNLISETKLNPASADFRLIDREVAEELLRFREHDVFLRGLIPWLGFKTAFLDFESGRRFAGKSKYSIYKMVKFAVAGITSFSTLPLKAAILVGIVIAMLSFALGIHSIYTRIFTNRAVPGWTSIMVGIFFIGGLSIIFLGILGEYIAKIFLQVKDRPRYVIKEKSGFEK
jgi:glycosyltransferase involved in cell wall biosynthesis